MRIGIDARLYKQTGVGRYIRNIIHTLQDIDKSNEYLVYLRSEEYSHVVLSNTKWRKKLLNIPWHSFHEQYAIPLRFLADRLDVAHFPYFTVPIFYPKPYLLTIHDLIVDHFDTGRASQLPYGLYTLKRMGYKLAMQQGIRRASGITVISKTTRQELFDHYHPEKAKVHLTYDALDDHFREKASITKAKSLFSFPYILYVGNAYPHKNLERLIEAFLLVRKQKDISLVLAGDDAYFYPQLRQFVDHLGLSNHIVFFGEADDTKLVALYQHASCLVFPSLMEGFGLPNFEALYCGVLPVISNIPVFIELWGDSLPLFDPTSKTSIAHAIIKTLRLSTDTYNAKVGKARKHIDDFSWKETAKKTLAMYQTIYQQKTV